MNPQDETVWRILIDMTLRINVDPSRRAMEPVTEAARRFNFADDRLRQLQAAVVDVVRRVSEHVDRHEAERALILRVLAPIDPASRSGWSFFLIDRHADLDTIEVYLYGGGI